MGEAPAGSALVEPAALAVQRSSGKVFLADPGAGLVDVFSSSGSFETDFGEGLLEAAAIAVDERSGLVYVASRGAVAVYKPNGAFEYEQMSEWSGANTPSDEFGEITGLAVDNSKGVSAGDLYVVDASENAVDVFKPKPAGAEETLEGTFLSTLAGAKLEEPNGVAVNASTGAIYVADSAKGVIDVYGSSGAFEAKLTGLGSPGGTFRENEDEEVTLRPSR